jgi:beta-1,4-N-acetylglucosaminyltransferase
MLALVSRLDADWYTPRTYVVAATDALGPSKASAAEAAAARPPPTVAVLPRAREVGQAYMSSVWTTLVALAAAVALVWRAAPDLLLVNGPGTCVPVVAAAIAARLLGRSRTRVVYVESIARTRTLSLTGRILYGGRLADAFFVQWPGLAAALPRAMYAGRLY